MMILPGAGQSQMELYPGQDVESADVFFNNIIALGMSVGDEEIVDGETE